MSTTCQAGKKTSVIQGRPTRCIYSGVCVCVCVRARACARAREPVCSSMSKVTHNALALVFAITLFPVSNHAGPSSGTQVHHQQQFPQHIGMGYGGHATHAANTANALRRMQEAEQVR
uniref:Uncharacterized protein n=1 Tax=Dunaliella tertiolecta TaxID=3047 RepID=A0A7S3R6T4_DUNTE